MGSTRPPLAPRRRRPSKTSPVDHRVDQRLHRSATSWRWTIWPSSRRVCAPLVNDSGRSSIFSRGYEYDEVNLNGLPSPMQSKYGTPPSLAAVDRVEIMRGPPASSTAPASWGVINMVLKRPTDAFKGLGHGALWQLGQALPGGGHAGGALNDEGSLRGASWCQRRHQEPGWTTTTTTMVPTTAPGFDLSDRTRLSVSTPCTRPRTSCPPTACQRTRTAPLLDIGRSTYLGSAEDFRRRYHGCGASLQHAFANGGWSRVSARHGSRHAAGAPSPTAPWTRRATPG